MDSEVMHQSQKRDRITLQYGSKRCSVTNSSDGLICVKRRAKDGCFFSKNTGVRRAKRRAKFLFLQKKRQKIGLNDALAVHT